MGFMESFVKTIKKRDSAVDVYNEYVSKSNNYRKTAFENMSSNHGWYKCVKCGRNFRKEDMDVDHILPQSLGGGNERENLQCICKHCNRSKKADTSDTMTDLARQKRELRQRDMEDKLFVEYAMKEYRKEQRAERKKSKNK